MNRNEVNRFSMNPDQYYKVNLFDEYNFERKMCKQCKKFFWSLDENREYCPNDEIDQYSFINEPPTNKRLDYLKALNEIKIFFRKNKHKIINRYPVICRWRDDLYFTIASIVNFQRITNKKINFEFPANPLLVPQICLRFKDIENVGITGKHFSSFCMIGQHSIFDVKGKGYWKDQCIDLDFKLLTEQFGIKKKEIVFVEDVWNGGGSFGPSLEYFVSGLELGNAVFTEFQENKQKYKALDQKIIDMGAGLERFSWITMGTPTAYDCCFGKIEEYVQSLNINLEKNILNQYFREILRKSNIYDNISICKKNTINDLKISQYTYAKISKLESLYLILDHTRTLIFAIADGLIPSNISGGYNLRIILRRVLSNINKINLKIDLEDIIDMHINYLKNAYPELENAAKDIKIILGIEKNRFNKSTDRIKKLADNIKKNKRILKINELIKLYESNGITPDYLKEIGVIQDIPINFYEKISKNTNKINKNKNKIWLDGIEGTELLFYSNDPKKFTAKVLKIFGKYVVLDKTAFYARGGGQEPDHGKIENNDVIDVNKYGNIVVHQLKSIKNIIKDKIVECIVDIERREDITRHHTSTHIINSASKKVLGDWVWQNSAFKDKKYGRLDITHHSSLTNEEVRKIEELANTVIQKNVGVSIKEYERNQAEQKFTFRIYQGGVIPVNLVRIVNIDGFDVEACGGTHVKRTGDIGIIKIIKTERIQDGVVRIEFVSGKHAIKYIQNQNNEISIVTKMLQTDKLKITSAIENQIHEIEYLKKRVKRLTKNIIAEHINKIIKLSHKLDQLRVYFTTDDSFDAEFHMTIGKEVTKLHPYLIYCVMILNQDIDIIVFLGDQAAKTRNAKEIMKYMNKILGGSGGGNIKFARGKGIHKSKIKYAIEETIKIIKKEKKYDRVE